MRMITCDHTSCLPVPVSVDERTGIWSVDSLPMILMPRHFWIFVKSEIESRLGFQEAETLFLKSGVPAARHWCKEAAKEKGIQGEELLQYYFSQRGKRGMGLFSLLEFDPEWKSARVRIDYSVYAEGAGQNVGRNVCYPMNGAFIGAMSFISSSNGSCREYGAVEVECKANGGDHCEFLVWDKS